MKSIKTTATLLLLLFAMQCFGQQPQTLPELTNPAPHPRLFMSAGAEKALMQKIKRDRCWLTMHNDIVAECDNIISLPPCERVLEGRRLLNVSREALRRIFFLSYSYRMTNDKSYAQRAEKEMLHIVDFVDWHPEHFLDVAEMTLAMSIGYDWCFNALPASSKELIKGAIVEKGLNPSLDKKYNFWVNALNNWNQVCHASLAAGAMSIYEDNKELARQIISRSIDKVPLSMDGYAPDGAYPEGIGYWTYGTSFNLLLIDLLEQNYKTDFALSQKPGFMPSALYSQHMILPNGDPFSYADVGTKMSFEPTVFWFYAKTHNPSLLYLQKAAFERDKNKKYLRDRLLPTALIYGAGSGAELSNPAEPKELMWTGGGISPVAIMRSSWSDPNATYLGFKAGTPSSPHGHMDVGSFFVMAEGVKWALDMGMQNYTIAEKAGVDLWNRAQESGRWDVYRYNNLAHNTLTFNDRYQRVDGKAEIDVLSRDENNMSVCSEITNVVASNLKSVVRKVSLVDKSDVVIEDDITTGKYFAKLRWNMMCDVDKIVVIDDNIVELQKNGKKRYLKLTSPIKMEFYQRAATVVNSCDSPNPGIYSIGWQAELPLNSQQHIKVVLSPNR